MAEQCADRNREDLIVPPHDDVRVYPMAVAEQLPAFRRIGDVDDDIDALFPDAQNGNLDEARRVNAPHAARQPVYQEAPVSQDRRSRRAYRSAKRRYVRAKSRHRSGRWTPGSRRCQIAILARRQARWLV